MKKKSTTYYLIVTALFVAIGLILPRVFHMIGIGAGQAFLPMHIPVLLCGFVCGWKYGGPMGFIMPLISSVLTGMPVIFPMAVIMAFELATYGALAGFLSKKTNIYMALVGAMLGGRVVSAIANVIILGFAGKAFAFTGFLTSAFVTALPGIAIQLVLIPLVIIGLRRAKVVD